MNANENENESRDTDTLSGVVARFPKEGPILHQVYLDLKIVKKWHSIFARENEGVCFLEGTTLSFFLIACYFWFVVFYCHLLPHLFFLFYFNRKRNSFFRVPNCFPYFGSQKHEVIQSVGVIYKIETKQHQQHTVGLSYTWDC